MRTTTPTRSSTAGAHTITREQIGTRYVVTPVRILVDPNHPADVAAVHALQDAIAVEQEKPGQLRRAEVGSSEPEDGSRCTA